MSILGHKKKQTRVYVRQQNKTWSFLYMSELGHTTFVYFFVLVCGLKKHIELHYKECSPHNNKVTMRQAWKQSTASPLSQYLSWITNQQGRQCQHERSWLMFLLEILLMGFISVLWCAHIFHTPQAVRA